SCPSQHPRREWERVTWEVRVLTFCVQPFLKILNCLRTHVTRVQNDFYHSYVPKTSLSSPPWPEVVLPDPAEETRHHAEVVQKVNELIATGQHGRLFAVVHFASHQWKVTAEDLILIENALDVACGERIRLEKVRLFLCVSGDSVTNRVVPDPRVVTGEVSSRRR
ncbi:39S ribosomal protein L21, mitochondrial-like, partial [Pteropus vampyrus]|uniref:Large ribosomal subunit protein bL21m n=1 Tax=Pteropus vampyrus TaxID=132908 RepID=A0A6P6C5X2_PTEVA